MDPGTAIAVGELSLKVISLISKYYSDVKNAKSDIQRLDREIRDLRVVFQKIQDMTLKSSLVENISVSASLKGTTQQVLVDVKALESKLDPGAGTRMMRHLGKRALKWPFEKKEVNEWVAKFERHKTSLNLALTTDQISLIHEIDNHAVQLRFGQEAEEQDRLLGKLHIAEDAFFNSYHRQHEMHCIAETRVELLHLLRDWGAKHQRPIFWLSGMAGTGKSTIARTLARDLDKCNSLGGSFFFSRASGSSNNAANFVGTFVYELANKIPQFKYRTCEAISRNSDVLRQGLRNQWEEFIIGPLSKTELSPRPTMSFIIDALDECGSDDDIRLILQLLVELKDLSVIDFGVFVTSRPEISIRLGFENMPEIIHQTLDLRDIPRQTVEHDIAVFLRNQLGRISQEHKIQDWPSGDDIQSLVQRANGLFIYAATVCGFVEDKNWSPQERLSEILQGGSSEAGGTVQLDEMYSEVLRSALTKVRQERETVKLCDRFKQVVGSIVTLSDTLSVSALAKLLNIPAKNVELTLGTLHSVLNVPNNPEMPIRLLHPSFHDFLSNEARCEDKRFFVKKASVHGKLLTSCLEVMSAGLKRNMCNLRIPGSSPQDVESENLDQQFPRHLQYACQYWVEHLVCADPEQWTQLGLRDGGIIHSFFRKYYLNWLEAMSLVGRMSEAVLMMVKVREILKSDENPALYSLIADANRFILSNRGILEKAPLQVYTAALVFSPKESLVRICYRDQFPTWLIRFTDVEDEWGPALQNLESPREPVTDIAFSPDGKYLASASGEIVGLWDPTTGALRSTLAHSDLVRAVAFSSKCQLATISGEWSRTVRIWDPVSGVICHVLEIEDLNLRKTRLGVEHRLTFAANDTLAVACTDGWLHSWDPKTAVSTTVEFSNIATRLLAFSRKGDLVFFREQLMEENIYFYELGTDSTNKIFFDTRWGSRAAFSSDGQIALSPSGKEIIVLCDISKASGKTSPDSVTARRSVLDNSVITALAFSPDNKLLVFSLDTSPAKKTLHSWDILADTETSPARYTLHSWDILADTESLIGTFSSQAEKLAFSPDGRQLAFVCYDDKTAHLWDPFTQSAYKIQEGHSSPIKSLMFSRDGRYLASTAGWDQTVRIWSLQSGELNHTLTPTTSTDRSQDIMKVVLSPDSLQLASVSNYGAVRLWDLVEGKLQYILQRGTMSNSGYYLLVYSNNGKELACSSTDGTLRIWNPENGDLILTLQGYSSKAKIAVFSPNGQMLASSCEDGIFIIWSMSTGDPLHKLKIVSTGDPLHELDIGDSSFIPWRGLAFSPDGQYFASVCGDGYVAVFDLMNGASRETLEIHDRHAGKPAFSHDSRLLAVSTFADITLWQLETGRQLETFHTQSYMIDLSFSSDGTYLETGDGEIEIGHLVDDTQPSSLSPGFRWRIAENWLMQGSRKMLWLPPDFRPTSCAYRDGLFVLGRESGDITFIEVDLNYRPPE